MSNNFDEFNYINRILRKIDEIEQNDLNKTNNNSYYINSGFIYIVDSKSGLISESISRNLFLEKNNDSNISSSSDSLIYETHNNLKRPISSVSSFTIDKNLYHKPKRQQSIIIKEVVLPASNDQKISINDSNDDNNNNNEDKSLIKILTQELNKNNNEHQVIKEDIQFIPTSTKPLGKLTNSTNLKDSRLRRFLSKFNPKKIKEKRAQKITNKKESIENIESIENNK